MGHHRVDRDDQIEAMEKRGEMQDIGPFFAQAWQAGRAALCLLGFGSNLQIIEADFWSGEQRF